MEDELTWGRGGAEVLFACSLEPGLMGLVVDSKAAPAVVSPPGAHTVCLLYLSLSPYLSALTFFCSLLLFSLPHHI